MSTKWDKIKKAGSAIKDAITTTPEEAKSARDSVKKLLTTTPEQAKKRRGAVKEDLRRAIFGRARANISAPTPKPTPHKTLSSKFKKNTDGSQKKISAPERLKEIKREDAMDNIKEVAKNLKYGGRVKPYGMKRGGSPVCRGMGKATRGGKYTAT